MRHGERMAGLLAQGKVRAIGVSNYSIQNLNEVPKYFRYCACSKSGRISSLLVSGRVIAFLQEDKHPTGGL